MDERLTAIAFDLNAASLRSLREALPGWEIRLLTGATATSLTHNWNPGAADLLIVTAQEEVATTLALCRFLVRFCAVSRDSEKHVAEILGPRGSLQTQAERACAPLLVLVSLGQEASIPTLLETGAHSCLMLPINGKEVASMLVHARAGNSPGRHTLNLEQAQSEDGSQDDGGQG